MQLKLITTNKYSCYLNIKKLVFYSILITPHMKTNFVHISDIYIYIQILI